MRVCSVLPCFVRMRLGKQYIPLRKRSCKVLGTKHLLWLPFHHLKTSPFRVYSNFPKLKLADMTRTFIVVFKIVLAEGGSSFSTGSQAYQVQWTLQSHRKEESIQLSPIRPVLLCLLGDFHSDKVQSSQPGESSRSYLPLAKHLRYKLSIVVQKVLAGGLPIL